MDDAPAQALTGKLARQPREVLEELLLGRKTVPVLSDGTPLSELIDIRKREIKLRVFDDPELHRLEMDKVWARCWIPVCHETDLPEVGDFKRGYIGEDRVLVTRAPDRSINVVLNVCAHRAMEVCWSDEGNTKSFKCPYHGWVFDLKGKLLGAPFEKEEYGDWDKSLYPLKAAKVAQRHGVYFATFHDNPPTLEDYLTEFVGFFDLIFGSHEMVSTGGTDLFEIGMGVIPANWKAVAEQNCGDGYHTATLHHSLVEQGRIRGGDARGFSLDCYDTSSTGGHGVRVVDNDGTYALPTGEGEFPFNWFIAGSMFPSCGVGMSAMWATTKAGKKVPVFNGFLSNRTPKGTGETVSANFSLSLMNREAVERMAAGDLIMGGLAMGGDEGAFRGSVGNDDPEAWMSETRVSRGAVTRHQTIKYNALDGASHQPPGIPEGLGLVHRGFSKDDNQWHFWLAYYDWMTRD